MDMERWSPQLTLVEEALEKLARSWATDVPEHLAAAMRYSLFSGGKRFRPLLTLLLSDGLGVHPQKTLPWACAVELIHTYSLIHDDLPCMDDDDFRRGQPTSHKKFGEATALLAGDALLTEAFRSLAASAEPAHLPALVNLLGRCAGAAGMVGGQALDLAAQGKAISLDEQSRVHAMKTGALILAAISGSGVLCGLTPEKQKSVDSFGALLGLAFQIADDIEDSANENEKGGLVKILGRAETQKYLDETSDRAQACLRLLGLEGSELERLLRWNQRRAG
jgi:geranylgeranyl diphosphate synthase type II